MKRTRNSSSTTNHGNNLIPIRIDVTANDDSKTKGLRLIDTLLIDRNVLPKTIDPDRLDEGLQENAWYLAKSIVSDAEVIGMGRAARHFTGRLDLWSWELVEQVFDCIIEQLRGAFAVNDDGENATAKKKVKAEVVEEPSSSSTVKEATEESLVPIRFRTSTHGHRIHDDFFWDPCLDSINAVSMAESIGRDLKIPLDVVPGLAISLAEQAHGLFIPDDGRPDDGPKAMVSVPATAAWTLEARTNASNLAQVVAQYSSPPAASSSR